MTKYSNPESEGIKKNHIMAVNENYLNFVLDQLSEIQNFTFKKMFGGQLLAGERGFGGGRHPRMSEFCRQELPRPLVNRFFAAAAYLLGDYFFPDASFCCCFFALL